jgi:hypothetical protein
MRKNRGSKGEIQNDFKGLSETAMEQPGYTCYPIRRQIRFVFKAPIFHFVKVDGQKRFNDRSKGFGQQPL